MDLQWTAQATSDVTRLHGFLLAANPGAATRTVQALIAVPWRLREQPRLGERLDEFDPREVRRILVGHYEMRYEIHASGLYVLRVWHTRENR
ncbi:MULTISPECIES: type II toxin-antitoxin system RelE/ParE family toxin [unclassified Lysobacter]